MNTRLIPISTRLAGIVTADDLGAAGVSPGQIRQLVRRGALLRLGRGVYGPAAQVAAAARDGRGEYALRVATSLALTRPGTVASHGTAAIIHGLDLLGPDTGVRSGSGVLASGGVWPEGGARGRAGGRKTMGGGLGDGALSLTRPPGSVGSRTGRPGVLVHAAALPLGHATIAGCVPVTSVARTVVDVARTSSFRAGVITADSALRRGLTSKADLHSVISACARWPGIDTARKIVAFSDARSESALESLSRAVFHEQGLPAPDLQVWVGDDEDLIARTDFLWREFRTIGEADGALKYADPSRARAQLERDARLREAGFEVVHFTWEEIIHSPARVTARIEAAFRRARILRSESPRRRGDSDSHKTV